MMPQWFTKFSKSQRLRLKRAPQVPREIIVLVLVVLIASITQGWHFLTTGRVKAEGIYFSQFHDSLWHLSLIHELSRQFPPQHPGISGMPLMNYHYLSDLIWMLVHKLTGLPVETVYFHLAPPIVSAMFSFSVFLLAERLSKSRWVAIAAVTLSVFGGSFGYLIPFILGSGTPWFANSFMLDQPFDQLTNVHTIFGFALFVYASSVLHRYLEHGRKRTAIFAGVLFGASTAVKAYAGSVAIAALFVTAILVFVMKKTPPLVLTLLVATGIFLILTLTNASSQKPPLAFAPGWILNRMVEDSGRFYNEKLTLLEQHYRQAGNVPRVLQIKLYEFLLYLVGNLGLRIIALVWFFRRLFRIKGIRTIELFLAATMTISLGLPLLLVQPVSAYNTIQFSPYALIYLSILLALWIGRTKRPVIAFLIVLILSLPTTVKTFVDRLKTTEPMSISEYNALHSLEIIPEDSVVLTPSTDSHRYLMKVPGLGGRRAYFSGETFATLTETNYEQRLFIQEEFFSSGTPLLRREEILKDAKITHIYSDIGGITQDLKDLQHQGFPIDLIFENETAALFEVI